MQQVYEEQQNTKMTGKSSGEEVLLSPACNAATVTSLWLNCRVELK